MNRLFVTLTAVALSAIPLTNAKADWYANNESLENRPIVNFCIMVSKEETSNFFKFISNVGHAPLSRTSLIILETNHLTYGPDLKGVLSFEEGKTFSFNGRIDKGLKPPINDAYLRVPVTMVSEVDKAFMDTNADATLTLTRPGQPPEIINIDTYEVKEAVLKKQACMKELLRKEGITP